MLSDQGVHRRFTLQPSGVADRLSTIHPASRKLSRTEDRGPMAQTATGHPRQHSENAAVTIALSSQTPHGCCRRGDRAWRLLRTVSP